MTSPRPSSFVGSSAINWREVKQWTPGFASVAAISRASHSGSAKASGLRNASQSPRAAVAPWFTAAAKPRFEAFSISLIAVSA